MKHGCTIVHKINFQDFLKIKIHMCTIIYEKKVHGIIAWNNEKLESIEMFIVKRKPKL